MNAVTAYQEHELGYQLHRLGRVAEAEPFYRSAIERDPDFAPAWANLGLTLLARRKPEAAADCQRTALRLNPEDADAQNNLGMALYAQGHIAEAENCFRAALRLRGEHPNATLNLGSVRQVQNHVVEAEALFRRALALGAEPGQARSNLALALMEQGRVEDAEQCLRQALAHAPDHKAARANLALALLSLGRLEEGWHAYESRWDVEAMGGAGLPALAQPRWVGQPLHGETVLLYAEQGFGDTLQFCRYAPLVAAAGGRVVIVAPRPLQRLLRTLDGIDAVLSEDDALPAFDYHCPLLSLPFAFGTRMETIPGPVAYLRADPAPWADVLGGLSGLKVGLVWAGKSRGEQPHAAAIDRRRSMRLPDMAPLLTVPGCAFVSLQLGPPARQLAALADPSRLHDVSGRLGDWADTAALIAGLDLVIAVDTAVAHLAGALGKPVWLLNRFDSCWRWFRERADSPWYPTMRIFRQPRPGDWPAVIETVRQALAQRVSPDAPGRGPDNSGCS